MEYNVDGMAPPSKPNIFKRAWQGITLPHYGRTIGFLTLLVIALSIPATIAFLQQQTNIRQKASGFPNGNVEFVGVNGNPLPQITDPNVYLKITLPQDWVLPSAQGTIQKSSPMASFIKQAYAQTACSAATYCERCLQLQSCGWHGVPGVSGTCESTSNGYSCPAGYTDWYFSSCSRNECSIFPSDTPAPPTPTATAATPTATPPPTNTPTTAPPTVPPAQGTILRQIAIQNADGGSGGLPLARLTLPDQAIRKLNDTTILVYWKLNTSPPTGQRTVQVDFYEQPNSDTAGRRMTKQSVTVNFAAVPTPTRTPFGCERKPSVMGPLGDVVSDDLYVWVQVDKGGQPLSSCSDAHDNNVCTVRDAPNDTPAEKAAKNADCPQNTSQGTLVNSQTSNWCRSIPGGNTQVAHCWQLKYIGSPAGTGTAPTAPPVVPTVPADQATPTPVAGCTYTQMVCNGINPAAADKVCTDANIKSNWCYAGKCVTCTTTPPGTPAGAPTATPTVTPTGTVTPTPGPASVSFSVILAGIGQNANLSHGTQSIWNNHPFNQTKQATIYLYDPGVNASDSTVTPIIVTQPQGITYNSVTGNFDANNLNLGNQITPGKQYQMLIKVPLYLRKRFPDIITINSTPNTPTIITQVVTLTPGDANNDNHIDALDYTTVYLQCLNQNQQTPTCVAQTDFNDDGYEDSKTSGNFLDYRLFIQYFGIKDGD